MSFCHRVVVVQYQAVKRKRKEDKFKLQDLFLAGFISFVIISIAVKKGRDKFVLRLQDLY